jgi:hypothetical protein
MSIIPLVVFGVIVWGAWQFLKPLLVVFQQESENKKKSLEEEAS